MTKTVQCPNCQKEVCWSSESLFRPFCSERCRLIDLGAWADNHYKVPCTPLTNDLETENQEISNNTISENDKTN